MTQAAKNPVGVGTSEQRGAEAYRAGKTEDACPTRANDPGFWNRAHRRRWLIGYRAEKARQQ